MLKALFFALLCLFHFHSIGQRSAYSVVCETRNGTCIPLYLLHQKETGTENSKNGNCRNYIVTRFVDSEKMLDSFPQTICMDKSGKLSVYKGDSIIHQFKPGAANQAGIINGRAGMLERKPVNLSGKEEIEQYVSTKTATDQLLYDPQKSFILEGTNGETRVRLLQGFLFDEINKEGAFSKHHLYHVNDLSRGDTLQVLQTIVKDKKSGKSNVPLLLTEYILIKDTLFDELRHLWFSCAVTDLKQGTKEIKERIEMTVFPEVIMINGSLAIPDTLMKIGIRINDPSTPGWMYYMFPNDALFEPVVEALYSKKQILGNDTLINTTYWNNALDLPLTWYAEYPLPWRESDDVRGQVVYVSKSGKKTGSPYKISKPSHFYIDQFEHSDRTIKLKIYSPGVQKIYLTVKDENDSTIAITPVEFDFGAGLQDLTINVSGLKPENKYKLIFKESKGKQNLLIEYRFISGNIIKK